MSWTKLLEEKRVAAEPSSRQEIDDLRQMAAVNLKDARVVGISAQGQYEFAYNAARLLATMVIRASGYRVTAKSGHHYYTFQAMQAAEPAFIKVAIYFDAARESRNDFLYDAPVSLSDTDAIDLLEAVEQFRKDVEVWIKTNN